MKKEKSATDKLVLKNFGINNFQEVIDLIEDKPEDFFLETFFTDKTTFLSRINQLANDINKDADIYAQAMNASRSGSMIASFASSAMGGIKVTYVKNRKLLVNYLSFFYPLKKTSR